MQEQCLRQEEGNEDGIKVKQSMKSLNMRSSGPTSYCICKLPWLWGWAYMSDEGNKITPSRQPQWLRLWVVHLPPLEPVRCHCRTPTNTVGEVCRFFHWTYTNEDVSPELLKVTLPPRGEGLLRVKPTWGGQSRGMEKKIDPRSLVYMLEFFSHTHPSMRMLD